MLLQLFIASIIPIVQVIILCGIGAICARRNILTKEGRKVIGALSFMLFNPCLIFTRLANTLTPSRLVHWWPLIVNMIISHAVGIGLGYVVVWLVKPPKRFRLHTVAATALGNVGNLPLVIVAALAQSGSAVLHGIPPQEASDLAISYVVVGLLIPVSIHATIGFNMLRKRHPDDAEPLLADSSPPATVPAASGSDATGSNDRKPKEVVRLHSKKVVTITAAGAAADPLDGGMGGNASSVSVGGGKEIIRAPEGYVVFNKVYDKVYDKVSGPVNAATGGMQADQKNLKQRANLQNGKSEKNDTLCDPLCVHAKTKTQEPNHNVFFEANSPGELDFGDMATPRINKYGQVTPEPSTKINSYRDIGLGEDRDAERGEDESSNRGSDSEDGTMDTSLLMAAAAVAAVQALGAVDEDSAMQEVERVRGYEFLHPRQHAHHASSSSSSSSSPVARAASPSHGHAMPQPSPSPLSSAQDRDREEVRSAPSHASPTDALRFRGRNHGDDGAGSPLVTCDVGPGGDDGANGADHHPNKSRLDGMAADWSEQTAWRSSHISPSEKLSRHSPSIPAPSSQDPASGNDRVSAPPGARAPSSLSACASVSFPSPSSSERGAGTATNGAAASEFDSPQGCPPALGAEDSGCRIARSLRMDGSNLDGRGASPPGSRQRCQPGSASPGLPPTGGLTKPFKQQALELLPPQAGRPQHTLQRQASGSSFRGSSVLDALLALRNSNVDRVAGEPASPASGVVPNVPVAKDGGAGIATTAGSADLFTASHRQQGVWPGAAAGSASALGSSFSGLAGTPQTGHDGQAGGRPIAEGSERDVFRRLGGEQRGKLPSCLDTSSPDSSEHASLLASEAFAQRGCDGVGCTSGESHRLLGSSEEAANPRGEARFESSLGRMSVDRADRGGGKRVSFSATLTLSHEPNLDNRSRGGMLRHSWYEKLVDCGAAIGRCAGAAWPSVKSGLKQCMTPPLFAILLAIPVGCISPLHDLLFGSGAPLRFVTDCLSMLGDCLIPSIMLILGATLSNGPGAAHVPFRIIAAISFFRLVVIPACGFAWVMGGFRIGAFPAPDPIYILVLLIQNTCPTAIMVHTMASVQGNQEAELSAILFWEYMISAFAVPICLMGYLYTVSAVMPA